MEKTKEGDGEMGGESNQGISSPTPPSLPDFYKGLLWGSPLYY